MAQSTGPHSTIVTTVQSGTSTLNTYMYYLAGHPSNWKPIPILLSPSANSATLISHSERSTTNRHASLFWGWDKLCIWHSISLLTNHCASSVQGTSHHLSLNGVLFLKHRWCLVTSVSYPSKLHYSWPMCFIQMPHDTRVTDVMGNPHNKEIHFKLKLTPRNRYKGSLVALI